MRIEWRVLIGHEAHVFNHEEDAKTFIKHVLEEISTLPNGEGDFDFYSMPLRTGVIEQNRKLSILKCIYHDKE